MNPIASGPVDLSAAWQEHVAEVLAPRDDGKVLHASDLHECDFALWQRLKYGADYQLPFDSKSFTMFERGHAYETRLYDALRNHLAPPLFAVMGLPIKYKGITGHPDFLVFDSDRSVDPFVVIDATTTMAKVPDWRYGHALKSAFYAVAHSAPYFAEWVLSIGMGGSINAMQAYWFETEDWADAVEEHIAKVSAVRKLEAWPDLPVEPPVDPRTMEMETWKCDKGYCRAKCDYNVRYRP